MGRTGTSWSVGSVITRILLFIAAFLTLNHIGMSFAGASEKTEDLLPPYKIVRSLQYVQDAVVLGDHSAGEMQKHLLTIVDDRLRRADQLVFEDKRNVEAAFIYAMSGGNPKTLVYLVERDDMNRFDRRLASALTDYFSGLPEKARPEFQKLLPEFADSRIGAYLTLVTANVTAARNENEALRLFDWARLLAPGTIIEESALRRATHVASRSGDINRALDNSERYVRRFLHSPYASQFVDIFVYAIVTHSETVDQERMEYVLSLMDRSRQREIYLRMARMSTIAGKEDIALLAASRAEALSGETRDVVRDLAGFYAGVAKVPSGDVETAVEAIAAIPDERLSERDRALRDAAKMIAQQVTAAPDPEVLKAPSGPAVPVNADAVGQSPDAPAQPAVQEATGSFDQFMDNKRAALDDIDSLLNETGNE
ncbi:chemotaxis protein [Hoeflea sp. TYP-13]|uniref:chemotaxis protein n=1 Tax=Hoeflea sp. TYP-13 TaxID=3230023 RepID=UPI0034C62106